MTDEKEKAEGIVINSNRGGTIYRDKDGNEIDAPDQPKAEPKAEEVDDDKKAKKRNKYDNDFKHD